MPIKTFGTMGVDWEERVHFDRLREERLARIKAELKRSEIGALLCFDMANIRYITNTTIGTWAIDKLGRFCLLPQNDEPINWDFGIAAKHHQMYCSWLKDGHSRAGISTLRGAMPPGAHRAEDVARKIRIELEERGLHKEPLGIDVVEPPVLFALQKEGITVVDGQQLMQDARVIKTQDEITLLSMACSMVDAAYDELYRYMRPGIRENECVGLVNNVLYSLGSEHVEGVNAISGERCNPHPHIFSDRLLRPGDLAFYDILHSYMGYRTCYYRTLAVGSASQSQIDAYKRCRYYLDIAINAIKPGVTTADVVKLWPKAEEFGIANEEMAFALQYGHGVGLAIWEKPVFSRLVSFDSPEEIKEGMVFALETYWPASDGWSAARIEEELVVTKDGCEVITRFPAEELLVVGKKYYTATGPLAERAKRNPIRISITRVWITAALAGRMDTFLLLNEKTESLKRKVRVAKDVIMPALGMAQETGTLLRWFKSDGDSVTKGEPLMEVETDKAAVEIEAPASGTLSSIIAHEGDVIPVGQRIAVILAPGETDVVTPPPTKPTVVSSPPADSQPKPLTATPIAARLAAEHNVDLAKVKTNGGQIRKEDVVAYLDAQSKPVTPTRILASPKAKRLAREHNIDLTKVNGTGPEGAILVSNLQSQLTNSPILQSSESITNYQLPTSRVWRVMVERLSQAWTTIPHFYLIREVNASRLMTWREKVQKNSPEKITYTDLLVKLTAAALRQYPRLNSSWIKDSIVLNPDINIGLAVAVEDGLLVPVIHHAEELSLSQLAARRTELVKRAQANKLMVDDLSGGTFTISNLGMYGVDAFNAIVNPPQAAILAVGRIADRVVPVNGQPVVQPMITFSLSCDHRAVDGARGAQFLQALADLVEEPLQLLN